MKRLAGVIVVTILVLVAVAIGVFVRVPHAPASPPTASFDRQSWTSGAQNLVQAFMFENGARFANASRETVYENASSYPDCFVSELMPDLVRARPNESMGAGCPPPVYAYALSRPVLPSTTLAPGRGVPPHVNGSYAGTVFGLVFRTPAEAHDYVVKLDSYLWNNRVYFYTPTTNVSRIASTSLAVTPAILWEYTGFYPSKDPYGGAWYNLTTVLMQRWNLVFVYREDSPHYKNYYAFYYATADGSTMRAYDQSMSNETNST